MNTTALIVMDIQNEYFENGGMELVNPIAAGQNAGKIISHLRERDVPIIHTARTDIVEYILFLFCQIPNQDHDMIFWIF